MNIYSMTKIEERRAYDGVVWKDRCCSQLLRMAPSHYYLQALKPNSRSPIHFRFPLNCKIFELVASESR